MISFIKEKRLSGEEVYDPATWRYMSSYIAPHKSGNRMKRGRRRSEWASDEVSYNYTIMH